MDLIWLLLVTTFITRCHSENYRFTLIGAGSESDQQQLEPNPNNQEISEPARSRPGRSSGSNWYNPNNEYEPQFVGDTLVETNQRALQYMKVAQERQTGDNLRRDFDAKLSQPVGGRGDINANSDTYDGEYRVTMIGAGSELEEDDVTKKSLRDVGEQWKDMTRRERTKRGFKMTRQNPYDPTSNDAIIDVIDTLYENNVEGYLDVGDHQPGTPGDLPAECLGAADPGNCRAAIPAWFYNGTVGQCQEFTWGGCLATPNVHHTHEDCIRTCQPEVCLQPAKVGYCRAHIRQWFYDGADRMCKEFSYGGCGGNENRFGSKERCELACAGTNLPCEVGDDFLEVGEGAITSGAREDDWFGYSCERRCGERCLGEHPWGECLAYSISDRWYGCDCFLFDNTVSPGMFDMDVTGNTFNRACDEEDF